MAFVTLYVGCTTCPLSRSARRFLSTGAHHGYTPGPITRLLRRAVKFFTSSRLRRQMAVRMQKQMESVEQLEKEQQWLKWHGSPLRVMGLPDHAELTTVRARYRALVLETHPDTAATTTGESDYTLLRSAYNMATNPSSLWHRNGSSPTLYRQLMDVSEHGLFRFSPVHVLAACSLICMLACVVVVVTVAIPHVLLSALHYFDPTFYEFMLEQEAKERAKREAGEVVDTDPKRLAPITAKKLLYPGRYVRGRDNGQHDDATILLS